MSRDTLLWALILAAMVPAAACGRGEPPDVHQDRAAAPGDGGGAPGGDETRRTVRIDPAMLVDLRVTTSPAESRGGGLVVTALGEARVDEEAYAEAGSPIPSRVTRLLVSAGDRVRAGQPLAELQSVELGQARAAYMEAVARDRLARSTLERKRALAAERIAPAREAQEAEAQAEAAGAELGAARARLLAMGIPASGIPGEPGDDASLFLLRAPVSGVVLERRALVGQPAEPSRALFTIADTSRIWVVVQVFERDVPRVRQGGEARVVFAALAGRSFTGAVTRIAGMVDPAARTVPVRVELINDEGLIRPGMSATAFLAPAEDEGRIVSVPATAMQRLDEDWCVFVPVSEGVFEIRTVGRGRDLGGEVEVVSGLSAGEKVVVEGSFLLKAQAEKARHGGEEHDH